MPDASDRQPDGQFDLESLPLDLRLQGSEGLDPNHASRLRMQFLIGQQASLVTQTQFADAKAAALMTLLGLVALNGPVRIDPRGPQGVDAVVVFVLMFVAIGFAMWSVIPRFPGSVASRRLTGRDRFSWPVLSCHDDAAIQHALFMRTAEASQLVMSVAHANAAMAHVLRRKFVALRIAFLTAALDLALIMLHVVGFRLG